MSRSRRKKATVLPFFNGHTAYIYIRKADQATYIPRVLKLLKSSSIRRCIHGVYLPQQYKKLGLPVPSSLDQSRSDKVIPSIHPGAPTLLAIAKPNCIFSNRNSRRRIIAQVDRKNKYWREGSHGYLPTAKKLYAFWIGRGSGVKHKKNLASITDIVNIAPTLAHLMGLHWPRYWPNSRRYFKMDGRISRDILK